MTFGFHCPDCDFAKPDVKHHECPECEAFLLMDDHLCADLQTTHTKTARATQYARYIRLREDMSVTFDHEPLVAWCFTDGATRGAYAALVITKDGIREYKKRVPRDSLAQRNVTAEMMGVALALTRCPPSRRVYVVSDYLGTGCWLNGKWKIKNADALQKLRFMSLLINKRDLDVVFIHTKGHTDGDNDFVRYNNRADQLCEEALRD